MDHEVITTASTIDAAVAAGAAKLGVPVANVEYEVLRQPKRGFLGFGEVDAQVRVYTVGGADLSALKFVNKLIEDLGLDATAELGPDTISNGDRMIVINGADAGSLIGHHGDTLEALQYRINLAANRKADADGTEHIKLTLDIENYRSRREQTLRRLARGLAIRVQRSHREVTLEPMSPYERRIIHSEVQNVRGVTTNSIGVDNNRRVVISWEGDGRRDRTGRRKHAKSDVREDFSPDEEHLSDDDFNDTAVEEEYADVEDLMKELEEEDAVDAADEAADDENLAVDREESVDGE